MSFAYKCPKERLSLREHESRFLHLRDEYLAAEGYSGLSLVSIRLWRDDGSLVEEKVHGIGYDPEKGYTTLAEVVEQSMGKLEVRYVVEKRMNYGINSGFFYDMLFADMRIDDGSIYRVELLEAKPEESRLKLEKIKTCILTSSSNDSSGSSNESLVRDAPNAPKRPSSAYMMWLEENRQRLTKPGMSAPDVSRAAGVEWNALKDKSRWEKAALADKARYERELAVFKRKQQLEELLPEELQLLQELRLCDNVGEKKKSDPKDEEEKSDFDFAED